MAGTRNVRSIAFTAIALAAGIWIVTGFAGQGMAGHGESSSAEEAAAAVAEYHQALASADTSAALALLATDVLVLEGGHLEDLEEYRSHHLPADMEFSAGVPAERTVVQAVVEGDAAWVISKSLSKGKFRDHDIDATGAELIVLSKEGDAWKIRAIHWSSYNNKK
jgi:ketosteroid isomerase-like protein